MKIGILSSLLLLVLTAYLIIPVLPIVDYLINKDYIAKNLCENRNKPKSCCKGKCYLVKQLKKAKATSEGESKNTEKRVQLKDSDPFLAFKTSQSFQHIAEVTYVVFNPSDLQLLAVNAVFVPPKSTFSL